MHPNSISNKGVDLVKEFEGLHELKEDGMVYPYKCSAGVLTQGFGSTRGIKADQGWTTEYCEERLTKDLNEHAEAIKHYVTVPLTQNQYDALVSFIFNLGATAFRNSSLLKILNQNKYHEVPAQLMRWDKARVNGKLIPLAGLTRRRVPKSLTKSKTMAGAGIAGMATALNEVSGQIQGLVSYAPMLKTVFLICAVGGIALAAYARFKDSKEGIH